MEVLGRNDPARARVAAAPVNKLSFITRISFLLAVFFTIDKGLAFVKALLFNKIVGLEGMGIFGAANNLPDGLSALLSGGALGIAFIPVLTEYIDRDGRKAAWDLFARIVNLAFLITAMVSVLLIAFAGPLARVVIVPFYNSADQALTAGLMRLDLVAILIFSVSGLVASSLQANQHFLLPALAPILYNCGQIFGVTILAPTNGLHFGPIRLPAFGMGLHGMVYGVILGAALHLLIQVPGLIKYQFRWRPVIGLRDPGVLRVLMLLWPRVLTMGSIQLYFIFRDRLASLFNTAGVGALNLGWTIEQVPETVIGTAIAVALLPSLAGFINRGQKEDFSKTVNHALREMLALALPVAAILAFTIRPLVASFFGYTAGQLDLVTYCTWAFLIGLVGDAWLEVAVRSFYANQSTRIPLVAAFLQAVAFVLVSLLLRPLIGLAGIPLAAALTFTTQAVALLVLLNRRFPGLLQVGNTALRAIGAAILAGVVVFLIVHFLPTSALIASLLALPVGAIVAIPLIWPEIRLLLHL